MPIEQTTRGSNFDYRMAEKGNLEPGGPGGSGSNGSDDGPDEADSPIPHTRIENSISVEDDHHTNRRRILINQTQKVKYISNHITTAKYNWISFLPKFLFEQFRRYANIFFLCIGLLQQIPNVSPTGRFVTIVPFTIILTLTAIKEIIEDVKRHR